jgi:hypothetical protein
VTTRVLLVPAATSALVASSTTPRAVVVPAETETTGVAGGPDTKMGAVPEIAVTPPPPPPPVTQTVPSAQIDNPEVGITSAG